MVQYNKNLINNKTINLLKKNNQKGGNLQKIFNESSFLVKIIVIVIVVNILTKAIQFMYKFKLNGVVYPIIFGVIFYKVYLILTFHMRNIGLSLTDVNKNKSGIKDIINTMKDILLTFPSLIPLIPQIPEPKFNQPFKGIREGIRSLMIPYKFKEENYRLQINFPKVQIPFLDPLAGICCVWSKFEKLLELFKKAFEKPKKAIKKIADTFIKLFNDIKKGICKAINGLKAFIRKLLIPIILPVKAVIAFLRPINKLKPGSMDKTINKLSGFMSGIQDFGPKGVQCGGEFKNNTKYEKNDINDYIINYKGPCINDIYNKIDVLNYENKFKDKVCEKKIKKMSIFKIYRKELEQKNGLIKYINKYTDRKFNDFRKKKLKQKMNETYQYKRNTSIYKPNIIYYNSAVDDYMSDEEINKMKQDLEHINETNNNLKYIQHGGIFKKVFKKFDPSEKLAKAKNLKKELNKLLNVIKKIPENSNLICIVVNKIADGIEKIGQKIYDIGNKITGNIPLGIKKFGQLISFIGKIIEWFIQTIIGKGVRIIEAAVELVFNLSLGNLPKAISTKIFKPIKAIFTLILKIVKLPFITFFMEIVEILTDIPRLFRTFSEILKKICITIEKAVSKVINALMAPINILLKPLRKFLKKFGINIGGSSNSIDYLLNKHNYELNIMIKRKYELSRNNNIDKNYLLKLDKLILEKKKKIKETKKLLLKYNKYNNLNKQNINCNLISKQLTYK